MPVSYQVEKRGRKFGVSAPEGRGREQLQRRVFLFWFPRELNKMADAGSKDDLAEVNRLLRQRGLPLLAPEPEPLISPPTFGPLCADELENEGGC